MWPKVKCHIAECFHIEQIVLGPATCYSIASTGDAMLVKRSSAGQLVRMGASCQRSVKMRRKIECSVERLD